MPLYLHELTHIILSLFVAFLIWKRWKKSVNLFVIAFSALLGGFLIDLDHLFDYFLVFGFTFNLNYFLKGYQFLKSDKIYIPFHSWELVIVLLILVFISFRKEQSRLFLAFLLIIFTLSLFLHLTVDLFANNMPSQSYSLIYRLNNNFQLKKLVYPNHYQKHLQLKKEIKL